MRLIAFLSTPGNRPLLVAIAFAVFFGLAFFISIGSKGSANDKSKNAENNSNFSSAGAIGENGNFKNAENTSVPCTSEATNGCPGNKNNNSDPCVSLSCISRAASFINSMNMTVDPCTDFYSFVCGKWIENNPLTSSVESHLSRMGNTVLMRVKEMLDDLKEEEHLSESSRKIKNFYHSCMDKDLRKNLSSSELYSDIKELGGWPLIEEDWNAEEFDWVGLIIQLFRKGYVNNMLFNMKVLLDNKNVSRSILWVIDPPLGLRYRFYYTSPDWYAKNITSYKNTIFKLANKLNEDACVTGKEPNMSDIHSAFEIERKIAKLTQFMGPVFNGPDSYLMTVEELELSSPKVPWKKLLNNLLPSDTPLTEKDCISVPNPTFFKGLNSILAEMNNTSKRDIANYIFYRVVLNAVRFLITDIEDLTMENFETTDIEGLLNQAFKTEPTPAWKMCVKITIALLPQAVTANYIKRYIDKKAKEEIELIVSDLKISLMDEIRSSKWLDYATRNTVLLKVKKMNSVIAYNNEIMDDGYLNDYYKDTNITENFFHNVKQMIALFLRQKVKGLRDKPDRTRWTRDNLLDVDAYYYPERNIMLIPVGILQDVMFSVGEPNYLKYGKLGSIIGHEMSHAFGRGSMGYDENASYKNWWTNSSFKQFEERERCYEKQYNRYYHKKANESLNGTCTVDENMADNSGLHAAYNAYVALLKKIGSEKRLIGLPYTEKQMFWISFASVWCSKETVDYTREALRNNLHAPARFRILGALSNMKEFSEDFECKLNTVMNPSSKCFFWI